MTTRRFKTCMGCPFRSAWSRCEAPGGRRDVMLDTRARARPPEWCPLRRGPITIELATDEERGT